MAMLELMTNAVVPTGTDGANPEQEYGQHMRFVKLNS